jgi:hypothetical protein
MYGFGTAVVNDQLQLQNVEIFYKPEDFIKVLRGETTPEATNTNWKSAGCPFTAMSSASSNNEAEGKEKKKGRISRLLAKIF